MFDPEHPQGHSPEGKDLIVEEVSGREGHRANRIVATRRGGGGEGGGKGRTRNKRVINVRGHCRFKGGGTKYNNGV